MASLKEMVAKQATQNPKFKNMTSEEVTERLFNRQGSLLRKTKNELQQAKAAASKPVVNLDLDLDGKLQMVQSSTAQNGIQMNGRRTLIEDKEVLSSLANVLRPLIGVARALAKSGDITKPQELYEIDPVTHKKTGRKLTDSTGEQLYNVDPVSQLKAICYVLSHNKQAIAALQTIKGILQEYDIKKLKDLAITKKFIDSSQPESFKFRESDNSAKHGDDNAPREETQSSPAPAAGQQM